jgi:hypothetical protein
MTKGAWFVVEAEDSAWTKREVLNETRRFLVSPSLRVYDEARELDDILTAASDKGHECRYCSSITPGCSRLHAERVEKAVLDRLRRDFEFDWRGVSVEPKARIEVRS